MAGSNPYHAVVSGFAGHGPLPFPLFYPLPAVVAGVPFALAPMITARAVFAAASIGMFAYLISARGMWTLAALLSAPSAEGEIMRDLSAGEPFSLLDDSLGWAWGYAGEDRLVGYVPSDALTGS